MKKSVMLLCFTGISLDLLSTINHELTEHKGIHSFVLPHMISFLLLVFIASVFFLEYRNRVKNAEPESQASFQAMKALFTYMPGAVMTLKKDFTIIDVNQLVAKVTGLEPHAIRGEKCYNVLGNGAICCNCVVQKALKSGQSEHGTQLEYKTDGKQIYGKQTAIPIKDRHGNIEFIYEIVIDITQEVALERENAEMLMDIVTAMAHLIESRDPSTGTHSINVQNIALSIGKIMGLTDKELKELSILAILHDIGKIGIPESILNKPERLTDFEFATIKRHPQIGYDAIKPIKRLQKISEAILDHHEHYNGDGYPNGKKQEEISMIARILSVADVFEALTADRVYRKAMSIQQAIDIIQAGKEQQFDPSVVDALLEIVYKGKERHIN